jgi:hypothetical protein
MTGAYLPFRKQLVSFCVCLEGIGGVEESMAKVFNIGR